MADDACMSHVCPKRQSQQTAFRTPCALICHFAVSDFNAFEFNAHLLSIVSNDLMPFRTAAAYLSCMIQVPTGHDS